MVESDLMQYLETTRGRVREVFRRLEAEGLVQIDKNRGASVRKVTRKELANITEVLEDISILIIRKAARRADEKDCATRLKESLKAARQFREQSGRVSDVAAFMRENQRYWGTLADVAGNPILSDIRLRLQSQMMRFAFQGINVSVERDKWISWHEDIIVDLLDGNVTQAVRHAKKSMADVWDAMLHLPDSAFGH